ncbi:hypothetical protein PIB30_070392 [Stylosanthes scabra]|uniref:Uncharacterized protein n=1 Tax=Stylosanthes scabra TaxID=79078 RepID=A0ABU6RNU2_9FABA|nr:hypothetical protein [Stylosanthes scabra]
MASSSSAVSVFDAHRFRTAHNEQLFDSYARRKKVIPEVGFNLEDDEYPEIMEQIALRGWQPLVRILASFWCKNSMPMQLFPMKRLPPKKNSLTRASSRIGKQGEPCTSEHYLQIVQGYQCSLKGICKNSKDSIIELHYSKEDGNNKVS